jgi:hypothetical protein
VHHPSRCKSADACVCPQADTPVVALRASARGFGLTIVVLDERSEDWGELSDIVEQTFVERAAALDAELAKASNLPEHEREDLVDWYAGDFFELGEELPFAVNGLS